MPRVGIVALLHESNTFLAGRTTLAHFQQDLLVAGPAVRDRLEDTHHEVGGFFAGLAAAKLDAVPIFAARALPFGPISAEAAGELVRRLHAALDAAWPFDGLLVAPHGAAVADGEPDFDGHWLSSLRSRYPRPFPIIGTLDLHANLSARTVAACDALIAYRTNPHLDQRYRGLEAAALMAATLAKTIHPTMAAAFPPLVANIERQATAEPHWRPLLDLAESQRNRPGVLSTSLVYGFPYSDVPQMGTATIAVTDNDPALAQQLADELAAEWWSRRADFVGQLIDVETAIAQATTLPGPVCLLDMGDNVGGGSAGDGTVLIRALHEARLGPNVAVINDPECVHIATAAGVGAVVEMLVGGKTDDRHGQPMLVNVSVRRFTDGRFEETEARHGGMREFDMGRTAVVETETGLTLVLTSQRTGPFSLGQLTSCELDPASFRVLVAKGVHAPVAAYRVVCRSLVRVNTPGATTADLSQLAYRNRRRPLFPLDL